MTDLDTRLRGLTELSPPSRSPLGADELHQRANRNRRRTLALRVVPAALVVVVLLAGAVALGSRETGLELTLSPPDPTSTTTPATVLSARDQELVGFLVTTAELRHQLNRESILTAAYVGSSRTSGEAELAAQRVATDEAIAEYRDSIATVRPGEGAPALAEAIARADSRLTRIDVSRRSVDEAQSEIYLDLDGYASQVAVLGEVPLELLKGVEQPELFRGVLTASNYGDVVDLTAATASRLTVAVEVGYFPFTLNLMGTGPSPTGSGVNGCGGDAASGGESCRAFDDPARLRADADQAEQTFETFADPAQEELARTARAGDPYTALERIAFANGVGRNDHRDTTPGGQAIDPAQWQAAALGRVDRMAAVERQLYEMVGTEAVPSDPTAPPAPTRAGGTATTSGTPVPGPAIEPDTADGVDGARTPSAVGSLPEPPNERSVDPEPNTTDTP